MDHRRNHHSRSRSRSRSRSPPSHHHQGDDFRSDNRNNHFRRDTRDNKDKMDRERIERERRERMARMRAEIDAEERGIAPASGDSTPNNQTGETSNQKSNQNKNNDDDDEELDDEQRQMMQMMGFGGFGTTKGKSVGDNQTSAAKGAASKNKGRKYRQYMNRKGGFNRPLDKMT